MLNDLHDAAVGGEIRTDLCIIGGGATGITIARELIGSRLAVVVLESGGLVPDARVQDRYAGTNTRHDFSLTASRMTGFGGTTQIWGGWCAPLDESDFAVRSWVPHSGWPITKADLLPYYERAQSLCELGSYRYDLAQWPTLSADAPRFDAAKLSYRLWQLSPPTRFGERYRAELARASNVSVLLNAIVTGIVASENGAAVRSVRATTLEGKTLVVRARAYVLACGGIENPRLLLVSNDVVRGGLGNQHDLVGRFFMEHPHPDCGAVMLPAPDPAFDRFETSQVGSQRVVVGFGPSEAAQRRLGILNSSLALGSRVHVESSAAWDALMKLRRSVTERQWPEDAGQLVWSVLRDLDAVLREGYARVVETPPQGFNLVARTETAPNPANRVRLADERDAVGMNRVVLDWRLGALEQTTVRRTVELFAAEMGRLHRGRVRINADLLEPGSRWSENLSWFGHHMGTTRMSDDPKHGVVDRDGRVHGMANLYVAGASVFPTSGFANPTLTIIALALRLADHLQSAL